MTGLSGLGSEFVQGILEEAKSSLPQIIEVTKTAANVSGLAHDFLTPVHATMDDIVATVLPLTQKAIEESAVNLCNTLFWKLVLPTCTTVFICTASLHVIKKLV